MNATPLVCPKRKLNMKKSLRHLLNATLAAAIGFSGAFSNEADAAPPQPARNCPTFGWSEGLGKYLRPNFPFPTQDTASLKAPDCNFHQWSWEAFVWATALISDSGTTAPRFMTLATPDELLTNNTNAGEPKVRTLTLAARSHTFL